MICALHLTVNPAGRLTLWGTRQAAERGKEANERYMLLVLTPQQQRSVENVRRSIQEVPSDRQP